MSVGTPSSSNFLQCGQESEPISTSFTLALGLPIMNPAEVALTTSVQLPPGGGLAWVIATVSLATTVPWVWFLFVLQPARARAAMVQARKMRTFIGSIAPVDHGYRVIALLRERRRAAASGNLRGKRLQTGAQLGIGNLAQALAELLGYGPELRPWRSGGRRRRLALPEHDAVDRGIAEEAVDPLDDHRSQMLDQRGVRPVDQQ